MEKYSLFLFLAFIAEIIGTVSGFGSSILFVPIASLYFDFKTVLGITAVFHVFSNLSKIVLFKKGVNKNIVLKLGIPAVLFVMLGAWLTTMLDATRIELFMNFALIGLSVYLMINYNTQLQQRNVNLYAGGAVSGFLAGLVGTGGAIRGVVLSAFHLTKDVFIATSALIDLGVDSCRAAIYVYNGYFNSSFVVLIPFLIGISIAGSYLGKLILAKTSEHMFRMIALGVILCMSAYQAITYFYTLYFK